MANKLEKMFVIVPSTTGLAQTFKTNHSGASITSSDPYYGKIVFLEETGEIVTHGKVFALNANLLNGTENEEGSIKYQINQVVSRYLDGDNATQALDTLQDVLGWIADHEGTDGSEGGYLLTDVQDLINDVKGTSSYQTVEAYNTAHGTSLTESEFNALSAREKRYGGLNDRVAVLEAASASLNLAYTLTVSDTNNVVSVTIDQDQNGRLDGTQSSLTVATESLHNVVGMTYTNGTWSAPQGSSVTNANALAVAADVATELVADEQVIATALNNHQTRLNTAESTLTTLTANDSTAGSIDYKIKAMKESLDATIDSVANYPIRVQVVEADGVITGVTVTHDVATVTRTARVTGDNHVSPNLEVANGQSTYFLTGADIAKIKGYVDDKTAEVSNALTSLDKANTEVKNTQNSVDYTYINYSQTAGIVTIHNVTNAIGAVAADGTVTTHGLIDAAALSTTLQAIDPWETYSGE